MPKKVKAEVLPPASLAVIPDVRAMLNKLVEEKVAEIMSKDAPDLFQPYFQSRRVTAEIRRNQTVTDHKKWSVYFDKYGCDVCGTKKKPHLALGRCEPCYMKTAARLRELHHASAEQNATVPVFVDRLGDVARAALKPLSPPLAPEKLLDLEWIAREALKQPQKALPEKRKHGSR